MIEKHPPSCYAKRRPPADDARQVEPAEPKSCYAPQQTAHRRPAGRAILAAALVLLLLAIARPPAAPAQYYGGVPSLFTRAYSISGAAAANVVQQNTWRTPRLVCVTGYYNPDPVDAYIYIGALIGATSSPATVVGGASDSAVALHHSFSLTFVVPASYYYEVTFYGGTSNSVHFDSWIEYQ